MSRLARNLSLGAVLVAALADAVWNLSLTGVRLVDEDAAIYWYAAREFARFRFREPFFYGQAYHHLGESLVAAPAVAAGLPPWIALPAVSMLIGLATWAVMARLAWRRGAIGLAILLLGGPLFLPAGYAILQQRYFGLGLLLVAIRAPRGLHRLVGPARCARWVPAGAWPAPGAKRGAPRGGGAGVARRGAPEGAAVALAFPRGRGGSGTLRPRSTLLPARSGLGRPSGTGSPCGMGVVYRRDRRSTVSHGTGHAEGAPPPRTHASRRCGGRRRRCGEAPVGGGGAGRGAGGRVDPGPLHQQGPRGGALGILRVRPDVSGCSPRARVGGRRGRGGWEPTRRDLHAGGGDLQPRRPGRGNLEVDFPRARGGC